MASAQNGGLGYPEFTILVLAGLIDEAAAEEESYENSEHGGFGNGGGLRTWRCRGSWSPRTGQAARLFYRGDRRDRHRRVHEGVCPKSRGLIHGIRRSADRRINEVTPIEGEAPKSRVTITQWDSLEKLQAWRNSPEYKEARKIGDKYAKFRSFVVDGLPQ